MASLINIEIKAQCVDLNRIRTILVDKNARFLGQDHQIDTYFKTSNGRLKLREGNIEQNLIFYKRNDQEGPKQSDYILFNPGPDNNLKEILTNSNGILVVVDKKREIYFIENVKFHLDLVENLGTFVEIEATGKDVGEKEKLYQQCKSYLELFEIKQEELVAESYSDLLLQKK